MKTTITIQGTHCNACKVLIEDVASEIPGITSCSVNFQTGKTDVQYNEQADIEKFKKEVESLGKYRVEINQ